MHSAKHKQYQRSEQSEQKIHKDYLLEEVSQDRNNSGSNSIVTEKNSWSQLRLGQGVLTGRSYHSMCYHFARVYIYGGYELHSGVKADFISFDYSANQINHPINVPVKNPQDSPGSLCRHSADVCDGRMLIFGGKKSGLLSSNSLFAFDFSKSTWTKLTPKSDGIPLPHLESHSSCIDEAKQRIIYFGGYVNNQQTGFSKHISFSGYINASYEYSYNTNTWKELQTQGIKPSQRSSHGAALIDRSMYVFGGITNKNMRLGDFWQLDCDSLIWSEIKSNNAPECRSGHSMSAYQDYCIVFGGIEGITKEANDLHAFNTKDHQWKRLEQYKPQELLITQGEKENTLDEHKSHNNSLSVQKLEAREEQEKMQSQIHFNGSSQQAAINGSTNNCLGSEFNPEEEQAASPIQLSDDQEKEWMSFSQSQIIITPNVYNDFKGKQPNDSVLYNKITSRQSNNHSSDSYYYPAVNGRQPGNSALTPKCILAKRSQAEFMENQRPSSRILKNIHLRFSKFHEKSSTISLLQNNKKSQDLVSSFSPSSQNTKKLHNPVLPQLSSATNHGQKQYYNNQNTSSIFKSLSQFNSGNRLDGRSYPPLTHSNPNQSNYHSILLNNNNNNRQLTINNRETRSSNSNNIHESYYQNSNYSLDPAKKQNTYLHPRNNKTTRRSSPIRFRQTRSLQSILRKAQIGNENNTSGMNNTLNGSHLNTQEHKCMVKESMNGLLDKIKRVSMNSLISREEKYRIVTDLRKEILLREFNEENEVENSNKNEIKHVSQHKKDGSNIEGGLRCVTTEAMKKAIYATESRKRGGQQDIQMKQQEELKRNGNENRDEITFGLKDGGFGISKNLKMSQIVRQVKVENNRIRYIRPQPRDGHSAVVVGDALIIIGGDRHRLSFNDAFELQLHRALDQQTVEKGQELQQHS